MSTAGRVVIPCMVDDWFETARLGRDLGRGFGVQPLGGSES